MLTSVFGGLWSLRSCSSFIVVDIPFVTQRPIPMVQRWTIEISQLRFALGGRRPWYASRAGSSSAAASSSTWSSTHLSLRRVYPMVQTVRQTWDFPVASHGGRRPCLQVEQVHFHVVTQRQVPWSKLFVWSWTFHSC